MEGIVDERPAAAKSSSSMDIQVNGVESESDYKETPTSPGTADAADESTSPAEDSAPRGERRERKKRKERAPKKSTSEDVSSQREAFEGIMKEVSACIRRACGDVQIYVVKTADDFNKVIGHTDDWWEAQFVGLDCEWHSQETKQIALIQLCFGRTCILYHLSRAGHIPEKMMDMLEDDSIIKAGVNIGEDVKRFVAYGVEVSSTIDLSTFPRTCLPENYFKMFAVDNDASEQASQTDKSATEDKSSGVAGEQDGKTDDAEKAVNWEFYPSPRSPTKSESTEPKVEEPAAAAVKEEEEGGEGEVAKATDADDEAEKRRQRRKELRKQRQKQGPLARPWKSLSILGHQLLEMPPPKNMKYTFHNVWSEKKPLDEVHIMYAAKDAIASLQVLYALALNHYVWKMREEGSAPRKISAQLEKAFESTRYSAQYHVYDITSNRLVRAKNCSVSDWLFHHIHDLMDGKVVAAKPSAIVKSSPRAKAAGARKPRPRQDSETRMKSKKCYTCGELGHIKRNCPAEPSTDQKVDQKEEHKEEVAGDVKSPESTTEFHDAPEN